MSPATVAEVFQQMPAKFLADQAQGQEVVYQFHITGEQAGDWQVIISGGQCQASPGVHASPTATITVGDQDWLQVIGGGLSPISAFMAGKLKVGGDLMAAQRLSSLFKLGA
ncbi:MAG: hypothetical protein C4525_05055 [Desulfarculus sp.]|nr:MAG: hypothetical protein C4525_05055 [Desulfarculus sp.]